MERTLSLGISPCPNDVFIFAGVLLEKISTPGLRFQIAYEDVETLNGMARRGELDIAKISYANYIHVAQDYELLPAGGALGRGVGPLLLVGRGAMGLDPEREILVPGEYTTANFLLDFYLRGAAVSKRFLPFDALYDELCNRPDAQGVVIHEKRFTYQHDGLRLVKDLGDYWEAETNFAIPLGAIITRRSLGLGDEITRIVRESLAWAEANRAEAFDLCRRYAQDLTDGVIQAHIDLYVNEYSRDLGPEGRGAVDFFLRQQRAFLAQRDGGSG